MRLARRTASVVLLIYWVGLFVLTHTPPQQAPAPGINDKVAHMLAYAVLAGLIQIWRWMRVKDPARAGMTALAWCLLYGVADELLQILVGRDCELLDWMADAAGAACAVVLLTPVLRYWRR